MICPSCKAKDTGDQRFCTTCGIILRKDALANRAPVPAIPKKSIWRMAAVAGAGLIGAFAGFEMMTLAGHADSYRSVATFAGFLIGAVLTFVVSGFRLLYLQNSYKLKLTRLHHQISSHLDKAIHQYEGKLEEAKKASEAPDPDVLFRLGTTQLLRENVQESLEAFQKLSELKVEPTPVILNNQAVAFAKAGRNRHAYESLEKAEASANGQLEVHANFCHLLSVTRAGNESANLTKAKEKVDQLIEKQRNQCKDLNRRGYIYLRSGQFREAQTQFQEALMAAKGDKALMANARNNLGLVKFAEGEVKLALQEFVQAVKLDPGHGRAVANHGICLVELDNARDALELLRQAAELDPKSPQIHSNHGFLLCMSGAVNEGIVALRKAEQLDPAAFEPVYNLGKAYTDYGINDVASRYLERASQIQPNSWQTLVALGVVMMQQSRFLDARKPLALAAELAPHSADALSNYGLCLAFTMNYEKAEEYLRAALKLRKDSVALYSYLAWIHCQQENASQASEELAVALTIDPKDVIINDNYGLTQIELKGLDAALRHFREVLRLKPSHKRVHYHIGYTHALMKKIDLAIGEWEKATDAERGYPDAFVNLGVAYYLMDRLDDAVLQFRRALTLRQDHMEDYSNLAMALAKQGVIIRKGCKDPNDISNSKVKQAREKFTQSIGMFDKALQLSPRNVILHSNRGLACFFGGRVEEAMQEWTAVSNLDAEYASRRGHLMQSVFDEAAVQFVSMRISDRIERHPFQTSQFLYSLAPSYDIDDWEVVIPDEDLKQVPEWTAEADQLERSLKALKQ